MHMMGHKKKMSSHVSVILFSFLNYVSNTLTFQSKKKKKDIRFSRLITSMTVLFSSHLQVNKCWWSFANTYLRKGVLCAYETTQVKAPLKTEFQEQPWTELPSSVLGSPELVIIRWILPSHLSTNIILVKWNFIDPFHIAVNERIH